MKLYTNPRSRGMRVTWTLEELGVPCDVQIVDMQKGEHRSDEYKKIHPLGLVPAMEIDGQSIIESGAMCVYLAEKYPEKNLGPGNQPAEYYQWCFYCYGSLEPAVMDVLIHTQWLPEGERVASVAEKGMVSLKKILAHLESHFGDGRQYLLGDRFSVADILTGGTLQWSMPMLAVMKDYPHVVKYVERLSARPASQKLNRGVSTN